MAYSFTGAEDADEGRDTSTTPRLSANRKAQERMSVSDKTRSEAPAAGN
jgi:hypothetical protein